MMSRLYEERREEQQRLRVVDSVLLPQGRPQRPSGVVFANLGLLAALLAAKMLPKLGFVYPWLRSPKTVTDFKPYSFEGADF
jgi:hypothetical protein